MEIEFACEGCEFADGGAWLGTWSGTWTGVGGGGAWLGAWTGVAGGGAWPGTGALIGLDIPATHQREREQPVQKCLVGWGAQYFHYVGMIQIITERYAAAEHNFLVNPTSQPYTRLHLVGTVQRTVPYHYSTQEAEVLVGTVNIT